jgi:hypothetical protein
MRTAHARMKFGGAKGCPYSREAIGRNAHSEAGSTYENASGRFSFHDSAAEFLSEVRIIA